MQDILVIDDEPNILESFRISFTEPKFHLQTAGTAGDGLQLFAEQRFDVVVADIGLPDMSGLEMYQRIQAIDSRVPVIFITGNPDNKHVIEAMRLGAYDVLFKPLNPHAMRDLVDDALEASRRMRIPAVVDESYEEDKSDPLIGRCPAMRPVLKAIGRVAPQDITVLILGETGTGKELVARAIWNYSRRAGRPFFAVNCAAIPEALLESELFGHEKGAFTGADRIRIGKFEQASGGTLFLDEVGDMSPALQAKALRVLQDQKIERVGGRELIQTDVRIIAATNRDLEKMVEAGQFRSDLYYRLCAYTITLPPLRERTEDLPLLIDHFLGRFCRELGRHRAEVTEETRELLCGYSWPGNVRQLQGVLYRALIEAGGPVLSPETLPVQLRTPTPKFDANAPSASRLADEAEAYALERIAAGSRNILDECLELVQRRLIQYALAKTKGNISQAASILGIDRGTLRQKVRALEIPLKECLERAG